MSRVVEVVRRGQRGLNGFPGLTTIEDGSGNRIINGFFDIWQRGLGPFTTFGAYTADRWRIGGGGGSVSVSSVTPALGIKFGQNNVTFAASVQVSGQSLTSHAASLQQRIEDVRSYADSTVTVLGWARRAAGAGNMSVAATQIFGAGGSPSAAVDILGQVVTLTSDWAPFAVTLAIPSLSGRVIGTAGNSSLGIDFFVSAGASLTRAAGLGIQSVTVQLSGIHIRRGSVAVAAAEEVFKKPASLELIECERYFETGSIAATGNFSSGAGYFARQNMRSTKRGVPTFTRESTFANQFPTAGVIVGNSQFVQDERVASGTGAGGFATTYTADAEL